MKTKGGNQSCWSRRAWRECLFCLKTFASNNLYEFHINSHTKEQPFECPDCDAVFGSLKCLARHKGSFHLKKRFQCDKCFKYYYDKSTLRKHNATINCSVTLGKSIRKTLVKRKKAQGHTNSKNRSKGQIKTYSTKGKKSSNRSSGKTSLPRGLINLSEKISDKELSCSAVNTGKALNCQSSPLPVSTRRVSQRQRRCPLRFKDGKSSVLSPVKQPTPTVHPTLNGTKEKQQKVEEFENSLAKTKENQTQFNRLGVCPIKVKGKTRFKCSICHNLYSKPSNLFRHHRMAHLHKKSGRTQLAQQWSKRYQCSKCSSAFGNYELLLKHKRKAHTVNLYRRTLTKNCNMTRHQKTHQLGKVQRVECTGKRATTFIDNDNLRLKRRFQCDKCFKYYYDQSTLRKHIATVNCSVSTGRTPGKPFIKRENEEYHANGTGQGKTNSTKDKKSSDSSSSKTSYRNGSIKLSEKILDGKLVCATVNIMINQVRALNCKSSPLRDRRSVRRLQSQRPRGRPSKFKNENDCDLPAVQHRITRQTSICTKMNHQNIEKFDNRPARTKTKSSPQLSSSLSKCVKSKKLLSKQPSCPLRREKLPLPLKRSQTLFSKLGVRPVKINGKTHFKCAVCNKLYSRPSNLFRHHRSAHSQKKSLARLDYQCSKCSSTFENYKLLLKHKRNAHVVNLYKCTICEKSFTKKCNMTRHQKSHQLNKGQKNNTCQSKRVIAALIDKVNVQNKMKNEISASSTQTGFVSLGKLQRESPALPPPQVQISYEAVMEWQKGVLRMCEQGRGNMTNDQEKAFFFLHLNRYDALCS